MTVEFWLSYNNGAEKMRLPVNPPSINVSSPFTNTDVEVVNLGEFTVIGDRGLKEYSFESFFPRDYNPSYCEYAEIDKPVNYVNNLEKWRDTRRPIRLVVTGTPINTPVTIRGFEYDLARAGEPGDIYYSISLKEYEFLEIAKEVSVEKGKKKEPKRAPVVNKGNSKVASKSRTVKRGDSLWKIAFEEYGNATRWRDIYNANKKVIGANPDLIFPGQKLVIPK